MLFALSQWSDHPRALIAVALTVAVSLILGIAFHEFSHALSAYLLGDTTAKSMGRLTLNPIAHLDPAGTLLMLLIGFGWGKPTPVNPYKLRNGPKAGMTLVSLAGPISNFLFAAVAALPLKFGLVNAYSPLFIDLWSFGDYIGYLCAYLVFINLILALFNLIPIAPLDGSKIAAGIFPGEMGDFFRRLEPYGPGIIMVVFMIGFISPNLSIFNKVMYPLLGRIAHFLTGRNL